MEAKEVAAGDATRKARLFVTRPSRPATNRYERRIIRLINGRVDFVFFLLSFSSFPSKDRNFSSAQSLSAKLNVAGQSFTVSKYLLEDLRSTFSNVRVDKYFKYRIFLSDCMTI